MMDKEEATKVLEVIKTYHIEITKDSAWEIVSALVDGDYDYYSPVVEMIPNPYWMNRYGDRINDLNDRFEIVYKDGKCVNVWYK